jgi:hypothetical protein
LLIPLGSHLFLPPDNEVPGSSDDDAFVPPENEDTSDSADAGADSDDEMDCLTPRRKRAAEKAAEDAAEDAAVKKRQVGKAGAKADVKAKGRNVGRKRTGTESSV